MYILGFGSLRSEKVSESVHYDCGCMLTETGTLVLPNNIRSPGSILNVPAVYVAYFATFGAMVSLNDLTRSHPLKNVLMF